MRLLTLPISFGEAADKVAILEIKRDRIHDPAKRANVELELAQVAPLFISQVKAENGFAALFARLKDINGQLWGIEELIREHERRGDFGAEFVRLARAVYQTNDERARVKRQIDVLFGSDIREEKSYVQHGTDGATHD
ncbi:MAG TPA: hypothetical protein VGG69_12005 [Rhizomicrobium sp.]|jgi:hypothetical protein